MPLCSDPHHESTLQMRILLSARATSILAMLLVACATEPSRQTSGAASSQAAATLVTATEEDDDMVCSREYPTGSNIPVTRCRTRTQVETEQAVAKESLRRSQRGGPNVKMGDN